MNRLFFKNKWLALSLVVIFLVPLVTPILPASATDSIIWQYGTTGVAGSGANQLSSPHGAEYLSSGNILISDLNNNRVIEVDSNQNIVWQYGTIAVAGTGVNQLNKPHDAKRLTNGNTLIADRNNHRVIEVRTSDYNPALPNSGFTQASIVWQYGSGVYGSGVNQLKKPYEAERLANGNTLISDRENYRVIEVRSSDYNPALPNNGYTGASIVWQYGTTGVWGSGVNYLNTAVDANRLANGNTLITDCWNSRVIEIRTSDYNPALPNNGFTQGSIVWQYGTTGVKGSAYNQLNIPLDAERLPNGNTLISDTNFDIVGDGFTPEFNDRVIEVDSNKNIVWQYGTGVTGSGDNQLNHPYSAKRLSSGSTLIDDRLNHRVIVVGPPLPRDTIIWQYGTTGVEGSGVNQLALPHGAEYLSNGNVLISDQDNHRVIEVDSNQNIVWQYGTTAVAGTGVNQLNKPHDAKRLTNGNTLITDRNNHRLIEVDSNKNIVWQYGTTGVSGSGYNQLFWPYEAERLISGNTLISDRQNYRVIEVDSNKNIVWQYGTTGVWGSGVNYLNTAVDANRLANGNTLITDCWNSRVIEIRTSDYNPALPNNGFSQGSIVWQYGTTGVKGSGFNQLNVPLDAERLPNGNTLISDTNFDIVGDGFTPEFNDRVIEVDANKNIVWQHGTGVTGSGDNQLNHPYSAKRLSSGSTLIDDRLNHRVIVVGDATPPTVILTNPTNLATDVAISTNVTATFSEDMDASTIDSSSFTLYQGVTQVPGLVNYDSTTKAAIFNPDSDLSYATTYTATIATAVTDLAGNPLASNKVWSFTPALPRYENTNSAITYGVNWTTVSYTSASGGSVTRAKTAGLGRVARFVFTGDMVNFITLKASNRGIAKVTIDGVAKPDLDLYSPSTQYKVRVTYAGLGPGTHTIEVGPKGTKNASSTDYYIDIDAFDAQSAIILTRYENTNPALSYSGTWSTVSYTSASGGSTTRSKTTGSIARFVFTGDMVSFITLKAPDRGIAKVTIDGVAKPDLDLYSSSSQYKVLVTYAGLGPGTHTIEVGPKGTKNVSSANYYVDVDAFDVY